jgi:hypothetical protein
MPDVRPSARHRLQARPALDHLVLAEDSTTVDLVIVVTLLAGAAVLVGLTRS